MKLCPKAIGIKSSYEHCSSQVLDGSEPEYIKLSVLHDRRTAARRLNNHIQHCPLCTT